MENAPLVTDDQKIADQIYARIKASVYAKTITVASVTILVTMAMAEVEKFTTLTGEQKKALVIHVIARLTDEIPAGQEDREAIRAATALLLPSLIDTIVAAASGKYPITVAGSKSKGCCGGCAVC